MREQDVREAVKEFYGRHAPGGRSAEDAFPAWWLHRQFEVAPSEAIALASSGSHDHGLDAFFFERSAERDPVLHLVQAKFTTSHGQIRDGIRGFRRTLERLSTVFGGQEEAERENSVWTRLRARVQPEEAKQLVLHCRVIHLSETDEDALLAQAKGERAAFEEAAATALPDTRVRLSLSGPAALVGGGISVVPGVRESLAFEGVETLSQGAQLFVGLGKLADLVRLYQKTGDSLFAKNVRMFNYRAAEQGPARYQRDTLRKLCITRQLDPLRFTMFHNGVTLHVTSAERSDGVLQVRNPGILNGCQTVKNAWRFFEDRSVREKIDKDTWEQIRVPLRIVKTADEELVREVTVSNNRQTAIRPSGFRANDSRQLALGERFREAGIFYERQENAFTNLKKSFPRALEEDYPNSFDGPLSMEDLAQALATLSNVALSVSAKVSDLFEDPLYDRLFNERNLHSVPLLVFATNVLRVAHLALKDMREKSSRLDPLVPSRFRFLATRVLVRWVVKNEPKLVEDFGVAVIVRPGGKHPFRDRLRRLLAPASTGLQTLIPERWGRNGEKWPAGTDKECSEAVLKTLRLGDYDVFERYAGE